MSSQEKLKLVQQHIDKRFLDLDRRLKLDKRIRVRFPGDKGKHALGVGIAKETWNNLDSTMGSKVP